MSQNNPLQQFYRQEKIHVALPSGGNFYDDGIIELNDDGEVGIKAMTAADEVLFKNPDSLMNGDALTKVIKSCVSAVKKPEELLANDVDTLVIAIRHASFGDNLDLEAKCPECKTENKFSLSMENTLSSVEKLEDSYFVKVHDNLHVYVRPYNFKESLKSIRKSFEQNNVLKHLEDPGVSEEQKLKLIGQSVDVLSKLNFDLVAQAITKIVITGNEDDVIVTDKSQIDDFIANIGRESAQQIQDKMAEINAIGIKKEFKGTCSNEECKHEWMLPIDFNPATFFTESLQVQSQKQ